MLVLKDNNNILSSNIGDSESIRFRIGKDSIIFNMLTTQLYSNPLQTVIREYLQNARDAHREVNKNHIPIRVNLPTEYNPELIIRDYGPGISPKRLNEVFTVFGETTKNNLNEHGGFGIGATSVWSYSDIISIKSFYGYKEYNYVGYIENDVPKMKLVSINDVDTDKFESGVEIKIPINVSDIKDAQRYFFKNVFFLES